MPRKYWSMLRSYIRAYFVPWSYLQLSASVVTDELPPALVLCIRRHQRHTLSPPRGVPVLLLKACIVVLDLRMQGLARLTE